MKKNKKTHVCFIIPIDYIKENVFQVYIDEYVNKIISTLECEQNLIDLNWFNKNDFIFGINSLFSYGK